MVYARTQKEDNMVSSIIRGLESKMGIGLDGSNKALKRDDIKKRTLLYSHFRKL